MYCVPEQGEVKMSIYFKNRLKEYREKNNYTQSQIGELIGVDTSQICRYEAGESQPSLDTLYKLSSIFHASIDELIGEDSKRKERKYTEDGIPIVDISKAQVVSKRFFSEGNAIKATIYPDGVTYSTKLVRIWEETEYILVTILVEEQIMIVRKSNEDERESLRWSRSKDGKKYSRKITGRGFAIRLYELMKWNKGYYHTICGYRGKNEHDLSEEIWVFELDEAIGIPMSRKTREKCGVNSEDLDEKTEKYLEQVEIEKQKEREERKEKIENGENPGPLKQYVLYPDKWGQYHFGIPNEKYEKIPIISMSGDSGNGILI